jgi:hypothetical protein
MLEEIGAFDVVFENGYIDVSSKALQIAIECGNTYLSKVQDLLFYHFFSEWIKEVWCIYTIGNKKIEIYKFIKPSQ